MGIIGIIALVAGCSAIYCGWSILKYIYTFFVKIFVFAGMVSFVGLLLLLFVSLCMGLAEEQHKRSKRDNIQSIVSLPTVQESAAYGIPVAGKKGFIMSPYSNKGIIDVRGYPSNMEIKDPYTGKLLIIP